MGFFSKLFGKKKVTLSPNEFIIKQVSNGKLYGRFMVADDIIHIETGASSIRPTWATSWILLNSFSQQPSRVHR